MRLEIPRDRAPSIPLPKDKVLRLRLKKKLAEYRERLTEAAEADQVSYLSPRLRPFLKERSTYPDTLHKIYVLEALLKRRSKEINTYQLSLAMNEAYPDYFDAFLFENACGVIYQYSRDNVEAVKDGSLPAT